MVAVSVVISGVRRDLAQSARSAEVTGSREIGSADAPRFTQIARAPVERSRQAATSGR